MPRGTSIPSFGGSIASIAASGDSGTESRSRSAGCVHKPGGAEHARWVFDYDESRADDDEAGYRFGSHAFVPGEYVSITEDDGDVHTFRVISVEAAT